MKKIIRSSAIVLVVCFFATTANAQMASDQPSLASKAVTAAKEDKAAPLKSANVQTASSVAAQPVPVAKPVVVTDVPAVKVATATVNPVDAQGVAAPVLASEAKVVTAADPKKAVVQ